MGRTRILVWDLPVRMFHWLLALSFAGAFATAESERLRDVHAGFGYAFLGLLAFRLVWGVIGSRHARFASFAYGPRALLAYVRSLLRRRPVHYAGHNPAGSWVIYAMLALGIATGTSGHALNGDVGGKWMESLHEAVANVMLTFVLVHVAGVLASSALHRENLVAAMVTGYRAGLPAQAIKRTHWATAAVLLVATAAVGAVGVAVPTSHHNPAELASETRGVHHEPSRHRDEDGDT